MSNMEPVFVLHELLATQTAGFPRCLVPVAVRQGREGSNCWLWLAPVNAADGTQIVDVTYLVARILDEKLDRRWGGIWARTTGIPSITHELRARVGLGAIRSRI
jgi:hypothetical protein